MALPRSAVAGLRSCCSLVENIPQKSRFWQFPESLAYSIVTPQISRLVTNACSALQPAGQTELEKLLHETQCIPSPFWRALLPKGEESHAKAESVHVKKQTISYAVQGRPTSRQVTLKVLTVEGAYLFDNAANGSKLVLTEEREEMWTMSQKIHDDDPIAGFAYQGNAGEGKSMWLAYVMYQAGQRNKDVIYQTNDGTFIIYTRGGKVYITSDKSLVKLVCALVVDPEERPWYLVDGDAPLVVLARKYVAVSPQKKHLKEFLKRQVSNSEGFVRYGNGWSYDEMEFLRQVCFAEVVSRDYMNRVIEIWGRNPRKCFAERDKNNADEEEMTDLVKSDDFRVLAAAHSSRESYLGEKVASALVRMTAANRTRTKFGYVFASAKIAEAAATEAEQGVDENVTMFVHALRNQSGGRGAGDLMEHQLMSLANKCSDTGEALCLRGLLKSTVLAGHEGGYKSFMFEIHNCVGFRHLRSLFGFPCLWNRPAKPTFRAVDFFYTAQDGTVCMLQSKFVGESDEGFMGEGEGEWGRRARTVRVDLLAKVLRQLPEQDVYPFVWVMSEMSAPWPKFKDSLGKDKDDVTVMITLQPGDSELLKKVVEVYVELPNKYRPRRLKDLEKVNMRGEDFREELGKQQSDETRSKLM